MASKIGKKHFQEMNECYTKICDIAYDTLG